MKACITVHPIEYKTVKRSGSRASVESVDAGRPREPGGPNRLGAINFWKKLEPWGNFSGQKCPNTTTVSGASGQHMRYCKRLAQNFRQGTGVGVPFWADRKWACQAKSTRGWRHRYLGSSCRGAMGNRGPVGSVGTGMNRSVLECIEVY